MTIPEIKAFQDSLVDMGLMTREQVNTGYGIYGPKTKAAAAELLKMQQQGHADFISEANKNKTTNPVNEQTGVQTPKYQTYEQALGAAGGDPTQMTDQYGQSFSAEDQAWAINKATADEAGSWQDKQEKARQDAVASLAYKQDQYGAYQKEAAAGFQEDKAGLDQNAASKGVLFSGGRKQKEQNLQTQYETDQSKKLSTLGYNVGNTARDYQEKYGNGAMGRLSQYYQVGGNTYNPNVATGGVGSKGLSSVYSPGAYDFQGSEVNAQKASAQTRAQGLLWNKGNKLMKTGFNNQYK